VESKRSASTVMPPSRAVRWCLSSVCASRHRCTSGCSRRQVVCESPLLAESLRPRGGRRRLRSHSGVVSIFWGSSPVLGDRSATASSAVNRSTTGSCPRCSVDRRLRDGHEPAERETEHHVHRTGQHEANRARGACPHGYGRVPARVLPVGSLLAPGRVPARRGSMPAPWTAESPQEWPEPEQPRR
jgi:hypothetical protein